MDHAGEKSLEVSIDRTIGGRYGGEVERILRSGLGTAFGRGNLMIRSALNRFVKLGAIASSSDLALLIKSRGSSKESRNDEGSYRSRNRLHSN